MEEIIKACPKNEVSRRWLIEKIAALSLGVTASQHLPLNAAVPAAKRKIYNPSERRLIVIEAHGGMSHLESWDPKPNSNMEIRGGTSSIHTNTGIQISEYFPKMAKIMDKIALIRSMHSPEGDHSRASYLFNTSYPMLGTISHPDMGAWVNHMVGPINKDLPANVQIEGKDGAGGYLGAKASPFVVKSLKNPFGSLMPDNAKSDAYREQLKLVIALGQNFRKKFRDTDINSVSSSYNAAIRLMSSESIKAFDCDLEDKAILSGYGEKGRSLLLARRLIEDGVRYVSVKNFGGWDHHDELWDRFPNMAKEFDDAVSFFLIDMERRGLLKNTTIAFKTEFGRTPQHNDIKQLGPGRDHYPKAFSTWMAGAGIKKGIVYGATDDIGGAPIENPVTPLDYNATLAHLMGISTKKEIYSPDNRPFTIARDGKVIKGILA